MEIPKIKLTTQRKKRVPYINFAGSEALINKIVSCAEEGRSYSVRAEHGIGKSALATFLFESLRKAGNEPRLVSAVNSPAQIIGAIAGVEEPKAWQLARYEKYICTHPQLVIIDESHHLDARLFIKIKKFIDAGSVFVLFGQPSLEDRMINHHCSDVLERFTREDLPIISLEEIQKTYPVFELSALEALHDNAIVKGRLYLRAFFYSLEDCLKHRQQHNLSKITEQIAEQIWGGLL